MNQPTRPDHTSEATWEALRAAFAEDVSDVAEEFNFPLAPPLPKADQRIAIMKGAEVGSR